MTISYHESRLGMPGYGWDAETLEEAKRYMINDLDENLKAFKQHLKELKKGGIQVITYEVKIVISK